jgi:urease subunit alpha
MRPALYGPGAPHLSQTYVAPAALEAGLADELGLTRRLVAIRSTRDVGKAQMVNNDALPSIEIDPESHAITVDGDLITPAPAQELPLAQLYKLF